MELSLSCAYLACVAIALLVVTISVCARHAALWPWRRVLSLVAMLWIGAAVAKIVYIDDIFPPIDGAQHESVARDVSDSLWSGRFADAFAQSGIGNPAYEFLVGVFYAVTEAPQVVTYAINGALGFWGLLVLLEILCRQTRCSRLPLSVIGIVGLLPSGLLWTTANLKEGPVLWGICMMCYWTVPADRYRGRPPRLLPILGVIVVGLLRPHIAVVWLAAVAAGALVSTKRVGLLFVSGVGMVAGVALLCAIVPTLFDRAMTEGVSSTLSERYDDLSNNENLGDSQLTGGTPIPPFTGLGLIMFRPWPTEVRRFDAVLAGAEVWCMAGVGMLVWWRARRRARWRPPLALVTHVVLLLLMGILFSYMYNMGLVVRQRLMCFPALLTLYFWPLLETQSARRGARVFRPVARRARWAPPRRRPALQAPHR